MKREGEGIEKGTEENEDQNPFINAASIASRAMADG
jgi:hypothetical protein